MTRRTQIVLIASCALMLVGLLAHHEAVFLYGLVLNRVARH